jgi:hypothetical protein
MSKFILSPFYEKKLQKTENNYIRNYNKEKEVQEKLLINHDYNVNRFILSKETKKVDIKKIERERKKRELLKNKFILLKEKVKKPIPSVKQELFINTNSNIVPLIDVVEKPKKIEPEIIKPIIKDDILDIPKIPSAPRMINKKRKEKIRVSIIVPMYNVEQYIPYCINSLINQTYSNIEIILIDDCSTDNTIKIVRKFVEKYPEIIKLLRNNVNIGTYKSINKGIDISTGRYITIIGADDCFEKDKVEKQVIELKKDIVACFCLYQRIHFMTGEKSSGQFGESTIMFKKEIIKDIGYYDPVRVGGDTEYKERINAYYGKDKISNIKEILYYALIRPYSLTTTNKTKIGSSIRENYKRNYRRKHKYMPKKELFVPLSID